MNSYKEVICEKIKTAVDKNVKDALAEDVGSGDITASLIKDQYEATATVIARNEAMLCGQPWFNEVFNQLNSNINIKWHIQEGSFVKVNMPIVTVTGSVQSILTGERTALNFLQLLSGVATKSYYFSNLVKDTNVKILDTRKTIPGLRIAQKYAVKLGGCFNHREGLFDAYLIKENHIIACGNILKAVQTAKEQNENKKVEVEVENLAELTLALSANADIVMLDNFTIEELKQAVRLNKGKAQLEASGGISETNIKDIAKTGVDFISVGDLTKNVNALDLSMRIK